MDCPTCGKSFNSETAVKIHHTKAHGESIAGVEVECSNCGDAFRKIPANVEKYDRHFCSTECKSEAYTTQVTLECDWCGEEFERRRSHVEGAERHYCSTNCKGLAYRDRVEVECANCGDQLVRPRAAAMRASRHYCSKACQAEYERGANSPNWKGGESIAVALRRFLGGESWRSVREDVHASRDGVCRLCGREESRNGRRLQVHHIVPVMAGGSHHRGNLMLLCHRCHRTVEDYTTRQLAYPVTELIDQFAD